MRLYRTKAQKSAQVLENELKEFRGAPVGKLVSDYGTNEQDKRSFPIMVYHSLRL